MIAGLPMYDRPETAAANDRYWAAIRAALAARGVAAPAALTRDIAPGDLWTRPDLVLAQTCGLPYRAELHGRVALVATPVFDLACEPGHYFSVVTARRDDPRRDAAAFDGATLAFNDDQSQSGWAAALDWAETQGIAFGGFHRSGGHAASARAVAAGAADLAAIDAVTWALIRRHDGFAAGLRALAQTRPTPALPYISAPGADARTLAAALAEAVAALAPADRKALCLQGIARIPAERYLAVPTPGRRNE